VEAHSGAADLKPASTSSAKRFFVAEETDAGEFQTWLWRALVWCQSSKRISLLSESVDELLEEGNAFEADVVTGVEDAGGADEREVRTHEVPEDDVPEEYLDEK
jgi:hypothetical protein